MFCHNCGSKVGEKWMYCPRCGAQIDSRDEFIKPSFVEFPDFGSLLEDIVKGIDEMTNLFGKKRDEKDFKKVRRDFRDLFNLPLGVGGVSVRISSTDTKEPRVDIKTFGNLRGHEEYLKNLLGIHMGEEKAVDEPEERVLIPKKPPKVTEEPKTTISRTDGRLEFRINVPGVKSETDINVRQIQESIEVRAYIGDKAYFTLFSIPPSSKICSKRLQNEVIIIEVEG
ncbi:MAG: zinc ribbon domain-containing protein [Candidatus Hydrothermarchaeales archaeon]